MKIKGVIFDLDGTLLDSMWVWDQVDADFLGTRGYEVPDDYQRTIAAMGFYETALYTIERFGLRENPENIIREWKNMAQQTYHTQVCVKPYGKELLERLKQQGIRLGIATAAYRSLFEECLRRNGVYDLFDAITETGEVTRGKGFPDIYLRAAEKLGCRPKECLVLEDIHPGILAAKKAGFLTMGVYEEKSNHSWKEIQRDADYTIECFGELLEYNRYCRLFCADQP